MESSFLNFHDGAHFSTISSPLYDQDILDDSEASLLDIMRDDFSYEASHFADPNDLWDQEQEINGDMALLPLTVPLDGPMPKLEPHSKEDFQKMLSDWQEHLGSMQASDSEDMDVKDIVGMDIVMPKNDPDDLPNDIFENSSLDLKPPLSSPDKFLSCIKQDQALKHKVSCSINLKEDFTSLSLENFLDGDDEDDDEKFGLTVAEDEPLIPECLSDDNGKDGTNDLEANSKEMPSLSSDTSSSIKTEYDEGCIDIDNIKIEIEEDCIDVETVSEQIPVLEAGDLKSLLEQFEASEAFNSSTTVSPGKKSILDSHLHAMATKQLDTPPTACKTMNPTLSHQNIRDSLPKEIIERIKASGRKKVIPVIPAMPSKRPGRSGTRMQDAAATLSRNKLLKLVSGNGGGESVQLDHDYCTFNSSSNSADGTPLKSFYHSDASEYVGEKKRLPVTAVENTEENIISKSCPASPQDKMYSRLPEYYMLLTPQKTLDRNCRRGSSKDDGWDKNSRKDSGLESGDVSDASEETGSSSLCDSMAGVKQLDVTSENKAKVCLASFTNSVSKDNKFGAIVTVGGSNKASNVDSAVSNAQSQIKTKDTPMVSVLKVNNSSGASGHSLLVRSVSTNSDSSSSSQEAVLSEVKERPQEPRKRKLNLEEYRSRLKELDRVRSSRTSSPTAGQSGGEEVSAENKEADNIINTSSTPDLVDSKTCQVEATAGAEEEEESGGQVRPQMQSVEVQTLPPNAEELKEPEKERRLGQARDRRHRQYRSRRASSSSSSRSSSSSSSSSSSHNSRRRRRNSQSTRRQRPSQRRSSAGHSISSSGSRSHSLWSPSRSNSSRSSSSSDSSRSRSRSSRRSPSRWQPRSVARRGDFRRRHSNNSGYHGWRRSRSPARSVNSRKSSSGKDWQLTEREKQRQVEERRVIYVGRIDEGTSKAELRRRFEVFGPIVDISVHFREHGDNYGFVTFAYKVDAYEAVEHGNDDPNLPRYDLCFGGRRAFCKTRYADLDGMATLNDSMPAANGYPRSFGRTRTPQAEDSFDLLLREAQAKLRKRKV
ncbi:serine-rich adhesin for platelets [Anabrus simplex]|uniref:serine-rich adhesin for platelets n=1 Tax=Anabrus simplex TaxID=316456 RepID=UPI0035A30DA2